MKKSIIILALTLIGVSAFSIPTYAKDSNTNDEIGMSFEIGADLVSAYLWRGQYIGGLSIQPSVCLYWKGLYVSGWGNIGADNWIFENLNPEIDVTIGYDNYGVQLDLTHLYYFGGESYFPKGGFKVIPTDESSSSIEAHAGFHLGDLVEVAPLSIDWYTTIYGTDYYINENGNAQRAWSTYIEVGYDFNLPLGLILGTKIGITPWKGYYSNYEDVWTNAKTVAINNFNLKLSRDFELKGITLGVWGECMLNCYGVDKTNVTTELGEKYEQRLNWCVGGSFYLSNEW
jgi:hypothetical protein